MKELINKAVMVHPELTHDPVNMQGFIGTIISLDADKDEVMVRFKNQVPGLYSMDALLMLIPGMEILDKLRAQADKLSYDQLLDIVGIYLLDTTGEPKWQKEALDIAMGQSSPLFTTVISVQDYIDTHLDSIRDEQPGRGR